MSKRYSLLVFVTLFALNVTAQKKRAKFEPQNGTCLLFIGQDLSATGGLDGYHNGYLDFFEAPSGVTVYTNLSPGDNSFGHFNKGNDGLKTKANWGAGDSCAQCYIDDDSYAHSVIAIGLSMVNHEKKIAQGQHDQLIVELAKWIKALGERPVFLRIGYEFDGWDWNHYKRKHYLGAWHRIHKIFRELAVNNVAFVWQSKGTGSNQKILEKWYPGDDLVDWCAYSYFLKPDSEMLDFARRHNKPVFIAEASPVKGQDNLYYIVQLKNEQEAEKIWEAWFRPFIETLQKNKDVIKAVGYINTNWSDQAMWKVNPLFRQVDARLQTSSYISKKWTEEFSKARYLKATSELWEALKSR